MEYLTACIVLYKWWTFSLKFVFELKLLMVRSEFISYLYLIYFGLLWFLNIIWFITWISVQLAIVLCSNNDWSWKRRLRCLFSSRRNTRCERRLRQDCSTLEHSYRRCTTSFARSSFECVLYVVQSVWKFDCEWLER